MAEKITIQELVVALLFQGNESGITKFNSALQSFKELAGYAERALSALSDATLGTTLEIAAQADALGEAAAQIGLAAQTYDALAAVVERNGGSVGELDAGLRTLTGSMTDFVATGKGAGADVFRAILGPNARERLREVESIDEALGLIADGIAEVDDPIRQVALANDALGRSGNKLLPTLQGGAAGIREQVAAMQELGTYSDALLKSGSDLSDGLAALSYRWRGLKILLSEETVPALVEVVDEALATFDALKEAFSPELKAAAETLAAGFRLVRDVLKGLREDTEGVKQGFAALKVLAIFLSIAAIPAMVTQMMVLVYWFSMVGLAAIKSAARTAIAWLVAVAPLALMAALITGIILVVEDLITYVQGGESAFGALLDKMREGDGVLATLADWLDYIFGGGIGEDLFPLFERLSTFVGEIVDKIVKIPAAIASAIGITGGLSSDLANGGKALAGGQSSFLPPGEAAQAGRGRTNNVAVGGSTVSVAVNGAGDPRATGAEVARQVGGVLNDHTTRAARDLAPAFAY